MLLEENPPPSLVVDLIIVGFDRREDHQVDFHLIEFVIKRRKIL